MCVFSQRERGWAGFHSFFLGNVRTFALAKGASDVALSPLILTPSHHPPPPLFQKKTKSQQGRACMLAFAAAVAAELTSGQGVLQQLKDEPTGVALAVILLAVGTLAPLLADVDVVPVFPIFTAKNEKLIGRVAMLGFVGLVAVEQVFKGGAALF
jgi:hypothetical protein